MKRKYIVPEVSVIRTEMAEMLCSSLVPGEGGGVVPDDNPYEGEFMSLDWDKWTD